MERESERLRLRKGMERSRETGSEREGEREREGGRETATVRFGEKTKTATEVSKEAAVRESRIVRQSLVQYFDPSET